jgi:GTP-binding protein
MPDGTVRLEFEIPARGLIGFRNEFLTDTKGEGIMNHSYLEYRPYSGTVETRTAGALVSMDNGEAVAFSIYNLQSRGVMFISPQDKVYSGMVIGESARPGDLDVNPLKGKQLSNMRTSGADEAIKLITPRPVTLESAMEWIEDDELIEVTPLSVRIRKRSLDENERKRQARDKKNSK